MMVKEIQTVK